MKGRIICHAPLASKDSVQASWCDLKRIGVVVDSPIGSGSVLLLALNAAGQPWPPEAAQGRCTRTISRATRMNPPSLKLTWSDALDPWPSNDLSITRAERAAGEGTASGVAFIGGLGGAGYATSTAASRRFTTHQKVATAFAFRSKKSSKKPRLLSGGGYEYRSPSSPISVTQSTGSRASTKTNKLGGYKKGLPTLFKMRKSSPSMPITTYRCPNVKS